MMDCGLYNKPFYYCKKIISYKCIATKLITPWSVIMSCKSALVVRHKNLLLQVSGDGTVVEHLTRDRTVKGLSAASAADNGR